MKRNMLTLGEERKMRRKQAVTLNTMTTDAHVRNELTKSQPEKNRERRKHAAAAAVKVAPDTCGLDV